MSKKITSDSTLAEILETPKGEEVLAKYGVPCLGCPMMQVEATEMSIKDICETYGLDHEEIINELNQE